MAKSKVETFIGFAIKAKKIALGAGAVEVQKRGTVFLLIVSGDASENTKKLAVKFKNRYNCPLILKGLSTRTGAKWPPLKTGTLQRQ